METKLKHLLHSPQVTALKEGTSLTLKSLFAKENVDITKTKT